MFCTVLQTLPLPDQPLLVLLLGGVLAVAGGLPFLLLPRSLWRSPLHDAADKEEHARDEEGHDAAAAAGATSESAAADGAHSSTSKPGEMQSPFQQHQQQQQQDADKPSSSSSRFSWWGRSLLHAGWSMLVRLLVAADEGLREFCASSFLDTAVSGLIVVGLILGSVVLSVVLLVQVRA
jgi:hypothetical protein